MPLLRDIAAIRTALEIDRIWAAYPLGDLAPGFFEHCSWFQPSGDAAALAVIYRAFTPPVLFTQGAPASLATILDEFCAAPRVYLHVRPEVLLVLAARYQILELRPMWRMVLDRSAHWSSHGVTRLSSQYESAVEELYGDGDAKGERPDF